MSPPFKFFLNFKEKSSRMSVQVLDLENHALKLNPNQPPQNTENPLVSNQINNINSKKICPESHEPPKLKEKKPCLLIKHITIKNILKVFSDKNFFHFINFKQLIDVIINFVFSLHCINKKGSFFMIISFFLPFIEVLLLELLDRLFYYQKYNFLKNPEFQKLKRVFYYRYFMSFYSCSANPSENSWPMIYCIFYMAYLLSLVYGIFFSLFLMIWHLFSNESNFFDSVVKLFETLKACIDWIYSEAFCNSCEKDNEVRNCVLQVYKFFFAAIVVGLGAAIILSIILALFLYYLGCFLMYVSYLPLFGVCWWYTYAFVFELRVSVSLIFDDILVILHIVSLWLWITYYRTPNITLVHGVMTSNIVFQPVNKPMSYCLKIGQQILTISETNQIIMDNPIESQKPYDFDNFSWPPKGNLPPYRFYAYKLLGSGSCRHAYMTLDLETNNLVVAKKFININENKIEAFEMERTICETAIKYANLFNSNLSSNKPLHYINPIICEVFMRQINSDGSIGHVKEIVTLEPFLGLDFRKFNSNNGYSDPDCGESMPAFSHFSYHESCGELIVCDLQGVKSVDKYMLTDPAINSMKGVYGDTDCGEEGIIKFFENHKCSTLCNKEWIWLKNKNS